MSSPKRSREVSVADMVASKMGTKETADKSIMMTSNAKTMAATGALNSAAKAADEAQAMSNTLVL